MGSRNIFRAHCSRRFSGRAKFGYRCAESVVPSKSGGQSVRGSNPRNKMGIFALGYSVTERTMGLVFFLEWPRQKKETQAQLFFYISSESLETLTRFFNFSSCSSRCDHLFLLCSLLRPAYCRQPAYRRQTPLSPGEARWLTKRHSFSPLISALRIFGAERIPLVPLGDKLLQKETNTAIKRVKLDRLFTSPG